MQLKRILVSLLVAMMILSMATVAVSAADATFDIAVESDSAAGAEVIEVNVVIKNNPGVSKFQIVLEYDAEALTPVTGADGKVVVTAGDIYSFGNSIISGVSGIDASVPGKITFLADPTNSKDITATGVIATISFKVVDADCSTTIGVNADTALVYSGVSKKVAVTSTAYTMGAHKMGDAVVTAPTCTEDGSSVITCTVCGYSETATLPAIGHTEEVVPGTAATCTAEGLTDGKKCSVCGVVLAEGTKIEKTAHTEEIIPAVEPTTSEEGATEGKKCSVCGEILVAPEVIAKKPMTWLWIVIAAVVVVGAAAVVVFVVAKKKK